MTTAISLDHDAADAANPLADEMARMLRSRLEEALDLEPGDSRRVRLSNGETSVAFTVRGADAEAVTVLLDRDPPTVAAPGEPAEVGIELKPEHVNDFVGGAISLGPLLLAGEAAYRGPIRKYLMVDAVIRGLLGAHWRK